VIGVRRRRGFGRGSQDDRLPVGANIPVPVGFQVMVGVGMLLVLLAASFVLAIVLIVALTHKDRQVSTHQVPYATALDEAALAAKGAANDARGFLISGNTLYVEEFGQRVGEAQAALAIAERHARTEPDLLRTSQARSRFQHWVSATRREFGLFVSGRRQPAVAASLGPHREIRKQYEASLAQASELARKEIRVAEVSYAGASRRAITILLACLLASLGIGVAVTIWVVRKILSPVYEVLSVFAEFDKETNDVFEARGTPETT
jgi:methyl-accepting chemotaxis protein